jgi:putative ABC transport system substrate-binding protein
MKRREFMRLLGGAAAAWPLAARAQPPGRMPRLSILTGLSENDREANSLLAAFRRQLTELGWSEGRNIRSDYCSIEGDPNRIQVCMTELTATPPDVFLAISTQALAALHQAIRSIPIVFVQVSGPVEGGFVASLARPGGNITGFTNFEFSIGGKWLGLLKEIAPQLTRVLIVLNPDNPGSRGLSRAIEAVAPSLGIKVASAGVRVAAAIESAIKAFAREPNGGLIVLPDQVTVVHRDLIVSLAARHGLPAAYSHRLFATAGGLLSYGTDLAELYTRAASYVDRILKGEKPADLPVQAPVKFQLVINLKSAKALGLTVPPSLLTRADEVIE